jgi:hypothetical protein
MQWFGVSQLRERDRSSSFCLSAALGIDYSMHYFFLANTHNQSQTLLAFS